MLKYNATNVNTAATGAAVTIATAQRNRTIISIQNTSDTAMWIRFGAAAAVDAGIQIPAGATWTNPSHFCPIGYISTFGTATKKFNYYIA